MLGADVDRRNGWRALRIGIAVGRLYRQGFGVSACGVSIGGVALLGLLAGQRVAKDYAGAAVIAAYFAVVLIGLRFF